MFWARKCGRPDPPAVVSCVCVSRLTWSPLIHLSYLQCGGEKGTKSTSGSDGDTYTLRVSCKIAGNTRRSGRMYRAAVAHDKRM